MMRLPARLPFDRHSQTIPITFCIGSLGAGHVRQRLFSSYVQYTYSSIATFNKKIRCLGGPEP